MLRFGGSVWLELCREAFASLKLQRRRSLLALLGVMIGSASVVAMLSFSHIARLEVMARFKQVGVDMVQVAATTGQSGFSQTDIALDSVDGTAVETGLFSVSRSPIRIGSEVIMGTVAAVSSDAMNMLGLDSRDGRSLNAMDGCNGAAVLGHKLASDASARLDETFYIGGYGFRIVGILPLLPVQALNPVTSDETVFIGFECAYRVVGGKAYSHALVRLGEGANSEVWSEQLKRRLHARNVAATVRTPKEMIAAMQSQLALMSAILVAIGSVSLLVGGVGVMNVMLMSVMERRREIGLRAAIGATPSEIVFIFIVEAVALSIGGGFLGALAGVALTALGCMFLPFSFAFDPSVLLWGTGVAGCVGLVFGIHPAISAARILPVEALRAD